MSLFDRFRSAGQSSAQAPTDTQSHAEASEKDAARLIEEGHTHEASGRLKEAEQRYLEAARIAPNPARAHLNIGNVLLLKGDLQSALESFRTAIKHKPDYAGAYYNIGNALQVNGRSGEAAENYRKALEIQPDYAEAHCGLGVALKTLGQAEDAVQEFRQALEIDPALAEARTNLGNLIQAFYGNAIARLNEGQLDAAAHDLRLVLKIEPGLAEAHFNLGITLKGMGRVAEAITSLRKAVESTPDFIEAYNILGIALHDSGQFEEAAAVYRKALAVRPDHAETHGNLGVALQELGLLDDAVNSLRRALQLDPGFVQAYNNLGMALHNLGQLEEAEQSYRRALAIKPDYAKAHNNLGVTLQEQGHVDAAATSYRRALQINPDHVEALCNLGIALQGLGQFDEALASYRRAVGINPDYYKAYSNMGNTLKDLGQTEEALSSYRRALAIKPDFIDAQSSLLFTLNHSACTTGEHLEEARKFGAMVSAKAASRYAAWQCADRPQRLRVGLVSGDLHGHPVGYFLENLLAHIDSTRIELIAYPTDTAIDKLTERIQPRFATWKPLVGLSDEAAARAIHADGIHVLIDLSGHTANGRLPVFAWKSAPVQVSWLGYWATTGVAEVDYFLADRTGVPETLRGNFTENVWYLPDTRLCFSPPEFDVQVAPLPAVQNGYITCGCFQNLSKVGDEVLAEWGRIFAALPRARLRMQCKQLGEPSQAQRMALRLQRFGIGPERVTMRGAAEREAYLAAHAGVDMILDTFPYPGGTTTCEALWMGVPTLTLAGDSLLARQGASLLTAAGLIGWIASSKEDYVSKAINFADDLTRLSKLRAGLRQQVAVSPLFDASRFAKDFEDALWGMWEQNRIKRAGFK